MTLYSLKNEKSFAFPLFAVVFLVVSCFLKLSASQSENESILVGLEWRFKVLSKVPVKNITAKNSMERLLGVLDSKEVASVVASAAKERLNFDDSVTLWSEEVFIDADCFIPLCRNEFEPLQWELTELSELPKRRKLQEIEEINFKPNGLTEFETCCALSDTRLPENENEVEECVVNPLQSCRTQVYDVPCPSVVTRDDRRKLQAGEPLAECIEGEAVLEMDVRFLSSEFDEACCLTCSCFGDPRCVDFEGESALWVLCDGRGPIDPNDPGSQCEIQEEVCLQQRDHENNVCNWIELTEEEEENWKTLTNGSRCVQNEDSGDSLITMYEFDEFAFTVRQAERGVIDKVLLRLEDETFSLTAEDCMTGDFNTSWRLEENGEVDRPPGSILAVQTVDGFEEIVWAISQTLTTIHVRLRCLKQRNEKGDESAPRIHVEALVEPESDFGPRNNLDGFCFSGEFDVEGTTENTEKIEAGEGCLVSGLATEETLDIARALCGESVIHSLIPTCLVSWCQENFFPSFDDYMECVISFGDGTDGFNFDETFCRAMTFTETNKTICLDKWETIGPVATIEKFYTSLNPPDLEDSCAESIEELPSKLGDCEAGVELQFLDANLEWQTFLALPERFPPCGNLVFNIIDHSELFENPIRWKQCTIPSTCITAINSLCKQQTRFVSDLLLLPEREISTFAPTNPPTNSPTESPFTEPTEFPTNFPTDSPTTSPTDSPSFSPTSSFDPQSNVPTAFPTDFPTGEPTESPTDFPTIDDSFGPTESPTKMKHDDWGWGTSRPTLSPTFLEDFPTVAPTSFPADLPTVSPTQFPTNFPTFSPTNFPTMPPTESPTLTAPTTSPTPSPTLLPTDKPSESPTNSPSESPTLSPSVSPTAFPTETPTISPTGQPTFAPTNFPTVSPTASPTGEPTKEPTESPTEGPTERPTGRPTSRPSDIPTESPTESPTREPTTHPTAKPTETPTISPTLGPSTHPTWSPSRSPTNFPTDEPTISPTESPSESPTFNPTPFPTERPTESPTEGPTESPTFSPLESVAIDTEAPTPFPTDKWGHGHFNTEFSSKSEPLTRSSGRMVETVPSEQKLEFKERGEVVFYGIYSSAEAAEKELMAMNVQNTISHVNALLGEIGSDKILAVNCELQLLVTAIEQEEAIEESDEDDSSEPEKEFDQFDPMSLGNVWRNIAVIIGGFFIVLVVALISIRSRRSSSLVRNQSLSPTEIITTTLEL